MERQNSLGFKIDSGSLGFARGLFREGGRVESNNSLKAVIGDSKETTRIK